MDSANVQSSSPSKKDRDATTLEACNHLIQGKRHLLVQDYTSAVNSLQEACGLLAACYGDLGNECGEAYYFYGKALLELSRKESGIFGPSKDESGEDNDDEDDDDDDEDEEEEGEEEEENDNLAEKEDGEASEAGSKNSEASEDLEESKKADEETISTETDTQETSSNVDHKEVPKDSGSKGPDLELKGSDNVEPQPSSSVDLAQPGPSGEQNVKKDDPEEITNLQLAWEVLELAKIIYGRLADTPEMKLKLAQVHSKLGEVAMESENYPQSKEDLQECLNLQRPLLNNDDRELAETYYQLGLVHVFSHEFDTAVNCFQLAIDTINCRIGNLNKIVNTNKPPDANGEDPVFHAKLELAELLELLPELQEKITDTVDLKKNTVKVADEFKKEFSPVNEESKVEVTLSPVKEIKPVTNIGHLVRKKRKPEDDPSTNANSDEACSKKSKPNEPVPEKNNVVLGNSGSSEPHINGKSVEVSKSTFET